METLTLFKSNLWHLDKIVIGIFLTSVVAKINFKLLGGSSKVLSNPLKACLDNMCTSSIMKILNFALVGLYFEFSISSLTSSIPVLDAASISKTSMCFDSIISLQVGHGFSVLQFTFVLEFFSQLRDFAINLAVVVFPTPLMPVNK